MQYKDKAQKKKIVSFTFSPQTIKCLHEMADQEGITYTAKVETLILSAAASAGFAPSDTKTFLSSNWTSSSGTSSITTSGVAAFRLGSKRDKK